MKEIVDMLKRMTAPVPDPAGPVNIVNLAEARELFAHDSPHAAALPWLLQERDRCVLGQKGTVIFKVADDWGRFFTGDQNHYECGQILLTSGLIDKPVLLAPYEQRNRWGKPRSRRPVMTDLEVVGADFSDVVFDEVDFFEANMADVDFSGATFKNVDFFEAEIEGSNFDHAEFINCKMNNADFIDCSFREAKFTQMRGRKFDEGNLRWIDLTGSDLTGASLHGVDIREGIFEETVVEGTDLWGANLIATRWNGHRGTPILQPGAAQYFAGN